MTENNPEWTSEQMIENSGNWSLAGDVALFNSLKKFSEGLLSQTVSISANVDNLVNNLESVSLKLDLTKNEFQSLRNTQFIENRVYEDDETVANSENRKEEKELTDQEKEAIIRESILKGLKVMKDYCENVEVSVSDSGEDVQEKSYILKPKDLYADRPLPYLVGSQEWYKSWHVGLLSSESESEPEKEDKVYSSSDSEEMLPKDKILGSETSSELDYSHRNTGPVANSTFNDTQDRRREMFHSSDESSELSGSVPAQAPLSSQSFAEELAAKLGNVGDNLEHVNRNPIKKLQQPTKYGILFSDEPPPLDEDLDETVLPKSAHEGLFSGGRDLFIDSQEEDLFFEQPKTSAKNENKPEKQEAHSVPPVSKPKSMVPKGLFDNSDSSSEDDMFMAAEKRQVKVAQPFLQPFKPTIPFIDDRPPEIVSKSESEPPKKKPAGGVSIFGEKTDLFGESESTKTAVNTQKSQVSPKKVDNIKKSLKKTSLFDESSTEDEETPKRKEIPTKEPNKLQTSKNLSLFDDSEDDTTPNAQNTPNIADKKKKVSLFDDNNDRGLPPKREEKKINLFNEETTDKNESLKKPTMEPAKPISLFDDDDDFFKEEEDIFASVPKKKSLFDDFGASSITKPTKGLFEDTESDTSSKASVSKDIESKKSSKSLFDDLESSQSSGSFIGSSTYEDNVIKEIGGSKETFSKGEPKKDHKERIFDDLVDSDNSKDFHGNFEETDPKQSNKKGILTDSLFEDTEITTEESNKKNDSNKSGEKDESLWEKDIKQEKAVESLFEDLESSIEEEKIFKPDEIEESKTKEIIEGPVKDVPPVDQKKTLLEDADDISVDDEQGSSKNEETKATDLPKYEDQDQKNQNNESQNVLQQDKPNTLGKVRKSVGFLDKDSDSSSDESFVKKNRDRKKTQKEKSFFIGKKLEEKEDITGRQEAEEVSQSKENVPEPLPEKHNKDLDEGGSKNYTIPPPIDLFDPTPPPPDPNWDAGSDNSGESDTFSLTDDGIFDSTTFNQSQVRSSLFDEAPLSLNVNESSGIVRDLNATRVETDDSSFYPHASSSRRFSGDLFNEQQSQDSFFVTKNKTEPLSSHGGSNLGNIPEKHEDVSSVISNLTPSGNVEDFEDSSVFEENTDEAGNMSASGSNFGEKPPVAKRVSLFEKKFGGDVMKSASFFEEKSDLDKGDSDKDKPGHSPTKASPGKLKHSLSINVGALLPGAARPKPRPPPIAKSISLDETDESATTTPRWGGASIDTPPIIRVVKSRSVQVFSDNEEAVATAQSGDQKFDNVGVGQTEVLASATKDRVRIPVKRRPSTRKARQEMVRKSITDFSMYKNEEKSSISESNDSEPAPDEKNNSLKDINDELGTPEDGLKKETSGFDASRTKNEDINDKLEAPENALKKEEMSGFDASRTNKESIKDKLEAPEDDLIKETSKKEEEPVSRGISLVFGKTSTEKRVEISPEEEKLDKDTFKALSEGPILKQKGLESGDHPPSALKPPESLESRKQLDNDIFKPLFKGPILEQKGLESGDHPPSAFKPLESLKSRKQLDKDTFKPLSEGPILEQKGLEAGDHPRSALKLPESLESKKLTTESLKSKKLTAESLESKKITKESLESKKPTAESLESNKVTTEPKSIFEDSFEEQSDLFKTKKSGVTSIGKLPKGDKSLFGGTDSDSDENLFGGAIYSTKKETNKPTKTEPIFTKKDQKSSIFSDKSDDEGEDLFGGKSKGSEKKVLGVQPKKSSIFDDSGDSDDEDLFGAKTSKSRGSSADADDSKGSILSVRSLQNRNSRTTALRKLENKKVTDFDPLSAFK